MEFWLFILFGWVIFILGELFNLGFGEDRVDKREVFISLLIVWRVLRELLEKLWFLVLLEDFMGECIFGFGEKLRKELDY